MTQSVKQCVRFADDTGEHSGIVCHTYSNGNMVVMVASMGKPRSMWVVPMSAVQERFTVQVAA